MRSSGFTAFLSSLFLSRLADQVLLFLVPLVVYQATQSVAGSGLAFFAESLPRYLSFPVCGALCDRASPLRLLRTSQMLRAAACAAGVLAGWLYGGVGWLIALSAICGVLTTQGAMAREVILPHVSPARAFHKVLAYSQTADQLGAVLGPLLAALLLTWMRWEWVGAAAALIFLLADAATALWSRTSHVELPAPEDRGGSWFAPIRTALGHVWHVPGLRKLVVLAAGVNLVVGVTLASSAALVTGLHARSAQEYAALQAAGAVATMLVLLTIARTAIPLRAMAVISFVLIFVGGVATALGGHYGLYAAGFLLVIGFDKMFNIFMRTSRQKIIPVRDYGKTTGVLAMLNNLTQPLAGLLVGIFAGNSQTARVILALSLGMAALGLVAAFMDRDAPAA
ncbi:MAG: MFS transporter [Burkholderiales bacterium]|nr:MFS transporter [Burkholderiales bacterium]